MNRNGVLGLFAAVAISACTGTGTTISVPLPATSIIVDPSDFLGDVACFPQFGDSSASAGGGMRRYVATLVSVRAGGALDAAGVALPSSPPTRCSEPVSFQRVVNGTAYVAEIDGYDVDAIRPLGTDGILGSRVMVDAQDRFVPPRWQTSCGKTMSAPSEPIDAAPDGPTSDAADATLSDAADATLSDAADATLSDAADATPVVAPHDAARQSLDTGVVPYGRCTGRALEPGEVPNLKGPVCARSNIAIPIRGCAPLREVNPPKAKTTAITVDLTDALSVATLPDGGQCLMCGPGVGQIAHFRVELDGSSEAPRTEDCRGSIAFELPPGKLATFTVTAYGAGASPSADACKMSDGGSAAGASDAGACGIVRQEEKGNRGVWCTRCFGQTLPGISLRATCDPLAASQRRPY